MWQWFSITAKVLCASLREFSLPEGEREEGEERRERRRDKGRERPYLRKQN